MRSDLALAALASAAVPGMKPVTVAGIGLPDDGRHHDLQSALVEDATGRRWVVRAPLTPVAGARLQRNDELVRQLARHVPFKVPAAVGYATLGRVGSAAVYPYVEGSPLDLHRLPGGPGLASAVGRALAAIHNITRGVFEEQDVPVYDSAGARQRIIAEVDRAAETGRVPTGLLARWEEAFDAAPMWQFATTPVHGAFTGGSVLVAFTDDDDAASGRVVAVTDWDEAMIGDPAVDLAELCSQASPEAWASVLESYTLARALRPDPYLHARARLVAELRHLRGLARAVAAEDEDGVRRAVEALRRADRLTEADDSLVPATARPSGTARHRPVGAVVAVDDVPDDAAGSPDATAPVTATAAGYAADEPGTGGELEEAADPDATMEVPRVDEGAGVQRGDDAEEHGDAEAAHVVGTPHDETRPREGDLLEDDVEQAAPTDAVVPGVSSDAVLSQEDDAPADGAGGPDDATDSEEPGGVTSPSGGDVTSPSSGSDVPPSSDPRTAAAPEPSAHEEPEGQEPADDPDEQIEPDAAHEDTARLHELYGMPDPARDTEGR